MIRAVRIAQAELAKLVTLPAFVIVTVITIVVPSLSNYLAGVSEAQSFGMSAGGEVDPRLIAESAPPLDFQGFDVATLGQVLVLVLGVLIMSSEYNNGQVRSTLIAMPGRATLLAIKAAVLFVVVAIIAAVSMGAAVSIKDCWVGRARLCQP